MKSTELLERYAAGERNFEEANLSGANLSGANLAKTNLFGANLAKTNLSGANLAEADLAKTNLSGANLAKTNLFGANLAEADLAKTNLSGANLAKTNLFGANLAEADLSGVIGLLVASDHGQRLAQVASAALEPSALSMSDWHACATTHCIAGWAIHLAGELGRLLEQTLGSEIAGLYLLGPEAHSHFFDTDEKAREFLQSILDRQPKEVNQ
jgi:hypothetical protein